MQSEPTRADRPRENWPEQVRNLVAIWQGMAEAASHIAHSKRAIFLAYVAEGFSEAQALDLVKSI